MISAVAVYRVSTSHQVESGNGLSAQKDSVHQYAERNGFSIVSEHSDEGISGSASLDKRKGLLDALQALKKGMVLIVHKMDRLSRDLMIQLIVEKEVEKKGCRIVSASGEGNGTSAQDSLMRNILGAFSAYEKNLISIRTKNALTARRSRGLRYSGNLPYGFMEGAGSTLQEHPEEQMILSLVRELRSEKMTWIAIAHTLNNSGHTNRAGRNWTKQNTYLVFRNRI